MITLMSWLGELHWIERERERKKKNGAILHYCAINNKHDQLNPSAFDCNKNHGFKIIFHFFFPGKSGNFCEIQAKIIVFLWPVPNLLQD